MPGAHKYGKARLIMTSEEIEIYKRLPDRESREDFIGEYLFDITVEDKLAVAFPKYRNYVRFKK